MRLIKVERRMALLWLCIAHVALCAGEMRPDTFQLDIPSYYRQLQEIFDSSPSRYLAFDREGNLTLTPARIAEISSALKKLTVQNSSTTSAVFSYESSRLGYGSNVPDWNVDSLAFTTGYLLSLPDEISVRAEKETDIPAWWLGIGMSELLIHPESSPMSGLLEYSDQRLDRLRADIEAGKVAEAQLTHLKKQLDSSDVLETASLTLKVRILERGRSLAGLLKAMTDEVGLGAASSNRDRVEIELHGVLAEGDKKMVTVGTIDSPSGFWVDNKTKHRGVEVIGVNEDNHGASLLFLQGRWNIPVLERSAAWNEPSAELYNRIKKSGWAELLPHGTKMTSLAEFTAKANTRLSDMQNRINILDANSAQGADKIIEGLLDILDSNAVNKIETESLIMYFVKLQGVKSLLEPSG